MKQTAAEIIDEYKTAFKRANGRGVAIVFENGWYRVSNGIGGGRYRAKQIKRMTETLAQRAAEQPPTPSRKG